MIAAAITGILVTIALPNFISCRNKSKIAEAVSTMESVRSALAYFAANCFGNAFPADVAITDWVSLVKVANDYGASLKITEGESGISFVSYDREDSNSDGEDDTYILVVRILGVPVELDGSTIVVTPQGVFKQTTSG